MNMKGRGETERHLTSGQREGTGSTHEERSTGETVGVESLGGKLRGHVQRDEVVRWYGSDEARRIGEERGEAGQEGASRGEAGVDEERGRETRRRDKAGAAGGMGGVHERPGNATGSKRPVDEGSNSWR
ncbi:hypothetical protein E2C01_021540 [Portunus trituberculatus]|uniref:Uncharacterized protein n=1 Tax=Portunus trituberculatus TaxID=210409 RepID=A0A5B7E3J1_PORTR|nr:hypothetical protein [Portunus trituberculatus]